MENTKDISISSHELTKTQCKIEQKTEQKVPISFFFIQVNDQFKVTFRTSIISWYLTFQHLTNWIKF